MKKSITETVTETKTFCDHCGKEVPYSDQCCIVCGRAACSSCFREHLIELDISKFPRFWPVLKPVETFHAYACPGCSDSIVRKFKSLTHTTERRNQQCEAWTISYAKQIRQLNAMREQAMKQHHND